MLNKVFESKQHVGRVRILKPLNLSDGFKNILNQIQVRGKSAICAKFLEWDNDKSKTFDSCYINRTDDDDGVTFVQSARLQRMEDQGGGVDPWTVRGRIDTTIGRLVRRIFGTKFDQKSVEIFINKYKAIVRAEKEFGNFEVVDGDQIAHWYLNTRYIRPKSGRGGVLGGSCMGGRECQNYFGIYTHNPNQVSLCILKNEKGDKIKGRALVWQLSKPENYVFMDRIYTADDADVNLFVEYAKRMGWSTKKRQSYRGDELILPDGEELDNVKMEIVLDDVNFNRYPYMDTFRNFYKQDKVLSNVPVTGLKNSWHLNDTGGYYGEYDDGDYEPIMVEDWRGNEVEEQQSVWCEFEDVWCLNTEAIYIIKGEHGRSKYYTPTSELLVYSEYSDSKYHEDDAIYSKWLKDWVYKRYAVKVYFDEDKEKWDWGHKLTIHEDIGKIGDDYFINKILYRDEDGKYHFIDDDFNPIEMDDDFYDDVPEGTRLDD